MSEAELTDSDDKDVSEKKSNSSADDEKLISDKKNKKSTKIKKNQVGENGEASASTDEQDKLKKKNEKSRRKPTFEIIDDEEGGEVPLLDQPAIVQGSRNRKTIVQFGIKNELPKGSSVEIPDGKGIPLGRLPIINSRIKRLRIDEMKHLHRLLFGRLGNQANFTSNIQKFRGFPFQNDSVQFSKKLAILNKLNMSIVKELLFFLDLDIKIKKKDEAAKAVLEFLLSPKQVEKSVNPPVLSHPKRRATKRNYFERDDDKDDIKKKKKPKLAKSHKENEDITKNNDAANEKESRPPKKKDKEAKNLHETDKGEDSGDDNNSELKKPAKKRKRNQLIEDQEDISENPKIKKKGKSAENTKSSESANKNTTDRNSESESDHSIGEEEELTDEDLKSFLKKALTGANLEKTTMKTVYNLINTHYPSYNCSERKDFIKDVVKSLIQS